MLQRRALLASGSDGRIPLYGNASATRDASSLLLISTLPTFVGSGQDHIELELSYGTQRCDSRNVVTLGAVRLAAAQYDVFDFTKAQFRNLSKEILDAVGRQVIGPRQVERPAK